MIYRLVYSTQKLVCNISSPKVGETIGMLCLVVWDPGCRLRASYKLNDQIE